MFNGSMSENRNMATVNVRSSLFLALPLVLLAFVALTVGFVASRTVRQPYQTAFLHLLFSDPLHMKVWLVTAALLLALGQLLTASRIYEVFSFPPEGRFYGLVHRWSGRAAVLLTLPVAYHCIFLLGFGTYDRRVFVHSMLGSILYGALLAKVLLVRANGFPGWALPIAGGLLFSILLGLWLTSGFWFLSTFGAGL